MFSQCSASIQCPSNLRCTASSSFQHPRYWLTLLFDRQRKYPCDKHYSDEQKRCHRVVEMTHESNSLVKTLFPSRLHRRPQVRLTRKMYALAFLLQLHVQRHKQNSCICKCLHRDLMNMHNTSESNQHNSQLYWQSCF